VDPSILPAIAVASWVGAEHILQIQPNPATGSLLALVTCTAVYVDELRLTERTVPGELHCSAVPAALATGSRRALRLFAVLAGRLPQGVPQGNITCEYRVLAMEMS
jgi:hypothetical protein